MIPNRFHFCYGLAPAPQDFLYVHYLAIYSAIVLNRPERATVYYHYEPKGKWWQEAHALADFQQVDPPAEIHGRPLKHFAHQADVLRLQRLLQDGGIYLDVDTLCLRPFAPLLEHKTVMGLQPGRGLCNATILSEADAPFLRKWLDSYRSFRSVGHDRYWDEHSVIVPNALARLEEMRSHVTVMPSHAFFYPNFTHWRTLFGPDITGFAQSYSVHLWETFSLPQLRLMTPQAVAEGTSAYAQLARKVLEHAL